MSSIPPAALFPALDRPAHYLPMAAGRIAAGFPSPADDFAVKELDLVELLVRNPLATFFWQVTGDSMRDAGIWNGDILVVDRSLKPRHGNIVVAEVDGDFTVKTLHKIDQVVKLVPANPAFEDITFRDGQHLVICGVVTGAVKRFTS